MVTKVNNGPSARTRAQKVKFTQLSRLRLLQAKKWRKVQLSTSNRSRVREGIVKTVFRPSARPRAHFPKSEKKLELRKDLAYETLQTRTRYDISFVSYRRSYFDNKNQIQGLRPARSRNWANLNSLLDEGFVRLQNAAKLNFLGQTVLELGRVL